MKRGVMHSANNRILAGLQCARELADYDASAGFSDDDARASARDARMFSEHVRHLPVDEVWLDDPSTGS